MSDRTFKYRDEHGPLILYPSRYIYVDNFDKIVGWVEKFIFVHLVNVIKISQLILSAIPKNLDLEVKDNL